MREGTSIDKNEKLLNIVFPTSKGWNEPGFPCKSVEKFLINSKLTLFYSLYISLRLQSVLSEERNYQAYI